MGGVESGTKLDLIPHGVVDVFTSVRSQRLTELLGDADVVDDDATLLLLIGAIGARDGLEQVVVGEGVEGIAPARLPKRQLDFDLNAA